MTAISSCHTSLRLHVHVPAFLQTAAAEQQPSSVVAVALPHVELGEVMDLRRRTGGLLQKYRHNHDAARVAQREWGSPRSADGVSRGKGRAPP
jgi:hypothetical protein